MKQTYYIVDVFTDKPFNGAQLAVFPEAEGLSDPQMQTLATELNLSDSVFITQSDIAKSAFRMRIFSPAAEVNFGGHATIAAAYILGKCGFIELDEKHSKLTFTQNAGDISVVVSNKDNDLFIQFSRKAEAVIDRYVPANKDLAAALSLEERDIVRSRYNTLLVSCEHPYLIVPLRSFEKVREAAFNLKEWSNTVAPVSPTNEILLFTMKSDLPFSNFHGRLVGPQIGLDEDPPIGSAMPAFTSYLSSHEHIRQGTYAFVIDRGTQNRRRSVLSVEMVNKAGKESEIRVGGPAVLVAEGTIQLPG